MNQPQGGAGGIQSAPLAGSGYTGPTAGGSGGTGAEPVVEPIMAFFNYDHLPPGLQFVSKPFCDTAHWVYRNLPRNAERTTALRKLLEAKDCAVRAAL